jgi:transposase
VRPATRLPRHRAPEGSVRNVLKRLAPTLRMSPATVRRQIASRRRLGEPVAAVGVDTGICQATLFRWKRRALIDAGVVDGMPSVEADELAAAHKRTAALEAELALTETPASFSTSRRWCPQNADARSLKD